MKNQVTLPQESWEFVALLAQIRGNLKLTAGPFCAILNMRLSHNTNVVNEQQVHALHKWGVSEAVTAHNRHQASIAIVVCITVAH